MQTELRTRTTIIRKLHTSRKLVGGARRGDESTLGADDSIELHWRRYSSSTRRDNDRLPVVYLAFNFWDNISSFSPQPSTTTSSTATRLAHFLLHFPLLSHHHRPHSNEPSSQNCFHSRKVYKSKRPCIARWLRGVPTNQPARQPLQLHCFAYTKDTVQCFL